MGGRGSHSVKGTQTVVQLKGEGGHHKLQTIHISEGREGEHKLDSSGTNYTVVPRRLFIPALQ